MMAKLRLGLLAALGFFVTAPAEAKNVDCKFTERSKVETLMGALPASVIGWVNCGTRYPDAGIFLVVKYKDTDEEALREALIQIGRTIDNASDSAKLVTRAKLNVKSRRYEIQTKSDGGADPSTIHYSLAVELKPNEGYAFVHSTSERETQLARRTLDFLHDGFQDPSFLADIEKTAAKPAQSLTAN